MGKRKKHGKKNEKKDQKEGREIKGKSSYSKAARIVIF